jgi:8-oxo-dGTP pyrophosphatase MutT (NUDIX family)
MNNEQELWDLYDKDRNLTGETHLRGVPLPDGYYHLGVHVWIKNSEGQYLISQRSSTRPTYPFMWECVGGSVLKGENSLQGAIREVKEEVGLSLDYNDAKLLFSMRRDVIDGKRFNDHVDVWLFHYDGPVDLSDATTDEVSQVKWLTVEEIKEMINQGLFVKTLKYFLNEVVWK